MLATTSLHCIRLGHLITQNISVAKYQTYINLLIPEEYQIQENQYENY